MRCCARSLDIIKEGRARVRSATSRAKAKGGEGRRGEERRGGTKPAYVMEMEVEMG